MVVEGFDVDLRYKVFPTFWTLIFQSGNVAVPPAVVDEAFEIVVTEDVRVRDANPTLNSRPNVPPPCVDLLPDWKASRETLTLNLGGNSVSAVDFGDFLVTTFWTGTLTDAASGSAVLAGSLVSETGSITMGFVYGSCDVMVNVVAVSGSESFLDGAVAETVINAGTYFEQGTVAVTLQNGSLQDAIQWSYGTDYAFGSTAFTAGTLATGVIAAGTFFESGSVLVAFGTGALVATVIGAGTWFDNTSTVIGFRSGELV